jgi:hypothetical protein
MKRPFESVREAILEVVQNHKTHSKQLIDQVDGLMLWIVGFSISGLSLIVSDLAKFNDSFTHTHLKWVLILLSLSIISGIVFRIGCYFIQMYNHQINIFIENAFSDKEFMQIDSEDISKEENVNEVLRRLMVDFGESAEGILNAYSSLDTTNPTLNEALLNDLKNHYRRIGDWARKDYEIAIGFAKDTMQKAYGYSAEQVNTLMNEDTAAKWGLWVKISYLSFLLSCSAFVSVVVTFCILY